MMESLKNAILYGKDFCEDTIENLRETVVTAVDTAKLQYKINALRNEINLLYSVLGRDKYLEETESSEEKAEAEEIKILCERIKQKEELLAGLEKQYRVVCGKVICPDCGKFMSDNYTFCPWCGRRIGDDDSDEEADVTEDALLEIREIDEL